MVEAYTGPLRIRLVTLHGDKKVFKVRSFDTVQFLKESLRKVFGADVLQIRLFKFEKNKTLQVHVDEQEITLPAAVELENEKILSEYVPFEPPIWPEPEPTLRILMMDTRISLRGRIILNVQTTELLPLSSIPAEAKPNETVMELESRVEQIANSLVPLQWVAPPDAKSFFSDRKMFTDERNAPLDPNRTLKENSIISGAKLTMCEVLPFSARKGM
mmetsp:Transcript_12864/g.22217  ORF Transcript_12864/g.22217 Transcript_12864/m.22217 type:complete len:216 (+) Transcript_12864:67-714(+)|eukprot:CAMPEP_0196659958 /NCGR_PEP_ID=MMETSP1086-20130531/37458_1 /TAXON_ID=77921 /ORGANISM="Cyanoptyche  gloeocystis , Strain SAG4.97" /LENGTH=215 /DNA_ID=CAMNT_0041994151 /DNA_START=62 /DNA_END=709 /DNA_ORIENTATION=-